MKDRGSWVLWAGVGLLCLGVLSAALSDSKPTPAALPTLKEPPRPHQDYLGPFRTKAKIYEEGPHLVVECREFIYPYDINARLSWVRQLADADAAGVGHARPIYFYDPSMKKFAQADPIQGVRLLEEP